MTMLSEREVKRVCPRLHDCYTACAAKHPWIKHHAWPLIYVTMVLIVALLTVWMVLSPHSWGRYETSQDCCQQYPNFGRCSAGDLSNYLDKRIANTFMNCSSRFDIILVIINLFWMIWTQMYHHVLIQRSSDVELFINERGVLLKMFTGATFAQAVGLSATVPSALTTALMWSYAMYVINAIVTFITTPFPSPV